MLGIGRLAVGLRRGGRLLNRLLFALGLDNLTITGGGQVVETRQSDGSLAYTPLAQGTPAFEGMYWSGTAWSDTLPDTTPVHPSETVQGKTIHLSYDPWTASETLAVGDKRTFNSVGNWMEVQSVTTGICGGSEPALPATGNTVVDGGVTWVRANKNYYASGEGRVLCEPEATNFLTDPTAPATHTVINLPAGDYILWVEGTGDANGAVEATPVTFNHAATGDYVVTVTGTLTFFQLEEGSVKSSRILTTNTTRPATNISTPNIIPANGFTVVCTFVPKYVHNSTVLLRGYVDADNYFTLSLNTTNVLASNKSGGITAQSCTADFTQAADTAYIAVLRNSTTSGLSLWSPDNLATDVSIEDFPVASTLYIGANNWNTQNLMGRVSLDVIDKALSDADCLALSNGTKTLKEVI